MSSSATQKYRGLILRVLSETRTNENRQLELSGFQCFSFGIRVLSEFGLCFSEQSLKALTIIHNFDLKRPDSTTAAQCLFDHLFPDVFEWILEHIGDLPMPRKSSKAQKPNPSYVKTFAA